MLRQEPQIRAERWAGPASPAARRPLLLGRRAFLGALAGLCCAGLVAGGRRDAAPRALPVPVDDADLRAYLLALTDLPAPTWALLVATAAVQDPGATLLDDVAAGLPTGRPRDTAATWAARLASRRMSTVLAAVARVYAAELPPGRAAYYGDQIAAERQRLDAGGQVDYLDVGFLVTQANREAGLMARPELADFPLVRDHHLDPARYPADVPALLAERAERRRLGLAFRARVAELLAGAPTRFFPAAPGPLTLLADLGQPTSPPRGYQLIRDHLPDLDADTLAARPVYYTAGDFLAFEPAAPPGRWADDLPSDQRAYAPTNALSPRLRPAEIVAPEHASRVLWPTLADTQLVVADVLALGHQPSP